MPKPGLKKRHYTLYLEPIQLQGLKKLARKRKGTVSKLIRGAIDSVLMKTDYFMYSSEYHKGD